MRTVVLVPTFNELENVGHLLPLLRKQIPELSIIVIDDSSPDGTADRVRELASELGNIELIVRKVKAGLGNAYRHGMAIAIERDFEALITMDADLSHDPALIPTFVETLANGADMVIGSRYVPGGSTPDWPWYRRALSRYGNFYTAWMMRLEQKDLTSGYRAYRTTTLRTIEVGTTQSEGYSFMTELANRVDRKGLKIVEIPIEFCDRKWGVSKMSSRIIAESMWRVTRWGVRDRFGRPMS